MSDLPLWKVTRSRGRWYVDFLEDSLLRYVGDQYFVKPFSTTHAAICAREVKPSFPRILLTCTSAVRSLTTRRSAISRLVFPWAINAATSRSSGVKPPNACLATSRGSGG